MASRPAASCIDLWKTYETSTGHVEALIGLDAAFSPGAVTAVVGPSGSGKSTLLKLLASLDRPTHGEIVVDGHHLAGAGRRRLRRLRRDALTYVFQRPADNFVPQLTLADHAALALSRGARERDAPDGRELFRRFGIAERLGDRPQALSGGEQARAAFALALLRGTPLILADEPTAELDEQSALALLGAIRAHADRGVAFVLATHDRSVTDMADAVLHLDRGRPVPEGGGAVGRPTSRSRPDCHGGSERIGVARGLSKSFRRGDEVAEAVRDVSAELHAGQVVALVGRSGSGKSTLLGILAGWQLPDSGEVSYSLAGTEPRDPAQLDWGELAVLPQKFGLMEELSVRENVSYPALLAGCLSERQAWIESALVALGLDELEERLPYEISVGQQQRTALARALALSPAVLLADEPTAHQDRQSRAAVLDLLRQSADSGTCCLIATHEDELREQADVTWSIAEGRLSPGGRPAGG